MISVSRGYGYRPKRYYPQRRDYTLYALRDIAKELNQLNRNLTVIIKILSKEEKDQKQGGEARKSER